MTRLVSTVKGIGRLEDDGGTVALHDVDATDLGTALQGGLDLGILGTAAVRDLMPTTQTQLLAPVPRPSKVWAVGYAYADHRTEVDHNGVAEEPVVFLKATSSVIGTGEPLRFPKAAPDEVDYDSELAVVNDIGTGDVQKGRFPGRAASVTAAKSFDAFTPRGSPLVTLDEFTDPNRPRQDSRTSQLIHPVPALVSYLSRQTTLEPGDVISTGTPACVGHRRGLLLRSCTEVRNEIEGVGAIVGICA